MRSRFSAFAKRDIAYLWRTLHPDHDDRQKTYDAFAAGLSAHFASKPLYKALTVLQATPVDQEGVASVTFRATIRHRGKDASFSERSLFALDGAGWRYIAGSID